MVPMNQAVAGAPGALTRMASRPGGMGTLASTLEAFLDCLRQIAGALVPGPYVYESPRRLFGLPLLAVDLGPDDAAAPPRHARGVIAIGNRATGAVALGLFLARGGLAVGLRAMGLAAIGVVGAGLVSVGLVGIGIVSVATVSAGYLAVGIVAVGYQCVGIVAIGAQAVGILGVGQAARTLFTL
jgi:hypothetical protein